MCDQCRAEAIQQIGRRSFLLKSPLFPRGVMASMGLNRNWIEPKDKSELEFSLPQSIRSNTPFLLLTNHYEPLNCKEVLFYGLMSCELTARIGLNTH